MQVKEIDSNLNRESSNKHYVKSKYEAIVNESINTDDLYTINTFDNQLIIQNASLNDAYNFFKSNRCIYTFLSLLYIKKVIKVHNDKLYMYNEEFNYWQVEKNNNKLLAKIREFLEKEYDIKFKYLELFGISINSKLSILVRDLKIDKKFNMTDLEFKNFMDTNSYWINFKNCSYNIETNEIITDSRQRKELFFDSYIDANYIIGKDLYLDTEDLKYFFHFYLTSLNSNEDKLLQLGQHLVYSILTKTRKRKAKQILFMVGEHDVGKSCLIDLFSSYFPEEAVKHIPPTKFGSDVSKANLLKARFNTVHEVSSQRVIPISEFNKTVWINSDQAIVNGVVYTGDYMQLHQVYASNSFFKVSNEYDPEDYLSKINFLIIDGRPAEKIINLSQKLISEKDYIISFFLNLKVYNLLKNNDFNFIELEDAIEFKYDIDAKYENYILRKKQKEEKDTDYNMLDYGLTQFFDKKVEYFNYDDIRDNLSKKNPASIIKEFQRKSVDYRVHLEDLYHEYVSYCHERDIEYFNVQSSFKKRIEKIYKNNIIIESKLKTGKKTINYEGSYKRIFDTQSKIMIYKKFKDKITGKNQIGYIGIRIKR